jgi:acetoin utilization deacetylase AcuC-like enzyme
MLRVLYHEDYKLHSPSPYSHPESPERLDKALEGLQVLRDIVEIVEPGVGDPSIYEEVHDSTYLDKVIASAREGIVSWLDPDTYISPGTLAAIKRLAGAVMHAVELAAEGEGPVLILGRPPGHHAGRSGTGLGAPTLGFCIVNTSALLSVLLSRKGRVLVVDFDAHHGNGTQDVLWSLEIMHIDIHQDSATIYPGTGFPWQKGSSRKPKVNINVPPGAGDDIYRVGIEIVRQLIENEDPDYIVVSAGFDAYKNDTPFVKLLASSETFHSIGSILRDYKSRMVIMLEGGYDAGLRRGLPAFLSGLFGYSDPIGDTLSESPSYVWPSFKARIAELENALGTKFRLPLGKH